MNIYLASDHGGYELKNYLLDCLKDGNFNIFDYGPKTFNPADDYPNFVLPVVKSLQHDPEARGVLICRNGVGVCMLANKFSGIRAGLSWNLDHARSQRNDDNTNILALPADYIDKDTALNIVKTWLNTNFSSEERFKRRLAKIGEIENDNTRNL